MGGILTSVSFSKHPLLLILLILLVFFSSFALSASALTLVNNASCGTVSVPSVMEAGMEYDVFVDVLNTGNTQWDSTIVNPYKLGSQSPRDNFIWGLNRVAKVCNLPLSQCSVSNTVDLKPGNQIPGSLGWYRFYFKVKAPSTAGTYDFNWRMVQDGKEWFGQTCGKNITVSKIDDNSCRKTFTSENSQCSLAFNKGITGFLDANGNYSFSTTIENTTGSILNVTGNWIKCRCPDGIGQDSVGKCVGWWNGEPNANYSKNCIPVGLPSSISFLPFEKKTINLSVSQYNNLLCGSFQVDYELQTVNGESCNSWPSWSVVHTCVDCDSLAYCGDGVKNQASEECDGNDGVPSGFSCSSDCKLRALYSSTCKIIFWDSSNNQVSSLVVGKKYDIQVGNIKNTGAASWSPLLKKDHYAPVVPGESGGKFLVGIHDDGKNPTGTYFTTWFNRLAFDMGGGAVVNPGEERWSQRISVVPKMAGSFTMQFEALKENTGPSDGFWFGQDCKKDITIVEPLKIVANKIVCSKESDLPNWGKGGPDIVSTTAASFLSSHSGCSLAENWKFQWAFSNVSNPGDDLGVVSLALGWHSFGPTDVLGKAETSVSDLNGKPYLWVREALKAGFVGFAYNKNSQKNDDNYSAEMYCNVDVLNYDNYDRIDDANLGKTYYCVAFNAPKGECNVNSDCNSLDKNYCSGSVIKHDEGKCVDHACVKETSTVTECNDGLFCNGSETCLNAKCVAGSTVNCSPFDLNAIHSCLNVPDGLPLTWDYFIGFNSVCNESTDACTTGTVSLTHACSVGLCSAECDANHSCSPTSCDVNDGCAGSDYYDYSDVSNSCSGCLCSHNECSNPVISHNDSRCTECQADSDCSSLDKDYCDGSLVKHDEGKCVNFSCESETSTVQNCADGLFCNGLESCENAKCVDGSAINCNPFNIPPVGECSHVPDNNLLTWDFFAGFTSVCDESKDICTTGVETVESNCDIQACGAECESDSDCSDTECDDLDGCKGNDYYDFTDVLNNCVGCQCTDNQCSTPEISHNDARCTECQIDGDCDKLDKDYCIGTLIMHDEGKCVDYSCEIESSKVQACNDGLYCNGEETCESAQCVGGSAIDCLPFNLDPVGECNYVPDGFPKTWDFFAGFTSVCNEQTDSCTQGIEEITSTCSKQDCRAECESNSDCTPHFVEDYCYFDGACSLGPSCSCSFENEFCPEPGSIIEGYCYWGSGECTGQGCDLNKTPMNCYKECDPETGPKTLPEIKTTKEVSQPRLECNYFGDSNEASECWFVTTLTKISLDTNYEGAETFYRQRWKEDYGSVWGSWSSWKVYESAFGFAEDSIHELEYYSVDEECDLEEEHAFEIDIVDSKAPMPVKTVGKPSTQWDFVGSTFYPEIGDGYLNPGINEECWGQDSLECWKVTLLTPISLQCTDSQPHPVSNERVCFRVELDADDATQSYCEGVGDYNKNADGYCCLQGTTETFTFQEESEHKLAFYCEDALGNKGSVDYEMFKVEGGAFEIQLNKKWNLISVPFALKNSSPELVFEDVEENVQSVWTYDAFTNQWHVYNPSNPGANNLTEVLPGWGYWLAAYNPGSLVLGGSLFSPITTPPSKEIKQGWNLIGYYGTDGLSEYNGPQGNGKKASCMLYSLGDSVLDNGWSSLETYWEPYNPSPWVSFGYDSNLDSGAGYWIAATEDGVYTYSTVC